MQDKTPTAHEHRTQLFSLGQVVATPGALAALEEAGEGAQAILDRHAQGDWGQIDKEDSNANNQALRRHERLLSAYTLKNGTKIWVITEADRSATTLLLPEDY